MEDYMKSSTVFGRRTNGILGLLFTGYLLVTAINIFLDGNFAWALYLLFTTGMIILPAASLRNWESFPPFEILLLIAIPFTIKGVELGFVASHTLSYMSVAAIGLLIVSILDTYTPFQTTGGFAVVLVSFSTVAMAGLWALTRWLSDVYLGTLYIMSEHALMWEFFASAVAGIATGLLFRVYFMRRDRGLRQDETQ